MTTTTAEGAAMTLTLPRHLLVCAALACALHGTASAQSDAATPAAAASAVPAEAPAQGATMAAPATTAAPIQRGGPPAGFVAPAEPEPDESNAQRARTQPGNNAPIWRAVRESGTTPGYSSLPDPEAGVLIQPMVQLPGMRNTTAGEAWRQVRNRWIIPYGGALFTIVLVALALFYWRSGQMGGHIPYTGRKIERFTYFERAAHWSVAISFVVLEVSGLIMAFGKFFLLPILGGQLFGWLTYAMKNLHNFFGPLFAVALAIFIVTFLRDNLWRAHDFRWLARVRGMVTGKGEEPSGKYNAGEKLVFWGGALFLGVVVVGSGLVLDKLVPGMAYLRTDMQVAHVIHAVGAVVMMALFLVHMYMGTVGMEGAYRAMRTGYVDEAWAKEHHALWYEDIKAGRLPAHRTRPAPTAGPGPIVEPRPQG